MSEKSGKTLGRGLSALLGDVTASGPSSDLEQEGWFGVRELEIGRISPNPDQPRSHFDEDALNELAESIADRGVLQPILVRPNGDGYQIIAGERRWRAAQRARMHKIPAIVRESDDDSTAELALIENIQREDLNALEEADGYRALIERHGHNQESVARIVHKSRSHVTNLLRLLKLPESVQQMLLRGDISMGHARAIANVDDPESLAKEILAKGLSVRQAESRARKPRKSQEKAPPKNRPVDADLAALERQLADLLGLKVAVSHNGRAGTVSLHYSSLDQLDMICQRLSGEPI